MPFIIDDLFLRQLGLSVPPFDMIWILEIIRDFAVREAYDPEKIRDQMKENRLMYDIGEITEEEYNRNHSELQEDLKMAKRAREMNLGRRFDILG